ncbi:hypothetical protein N7494_012618 [Penicillium frequentans]|uniref:Uncharacterized protein n=1 Tax=Penicillium frequentans TaxID=3151616 RepID=A0AAD6CMR9_9EURO|nr:hypothetical protein N7494_012618 [Penicillium glabrum]
MTDKKWLRSMRHSSFAVDDHIPIAGKDQLGPPTGSPDLPVVSWWDGTSAISGVGRSTGTKYEGNTCGVGGHNFESGS